MYCSPKSRIISFQSQWVTRPSICKDLDWHEHHQVLALPDSGKTALNQAQQRLASGKSCVFLLQLKSSGFSLNLEGFAKLCFHNNAGNGLVLLQSGKKSILGNFKSCHWEECHPMAGHRSVGCFGHGTQWKEETLVFIQLLL